MKGCRSDTSPIGGHWRQPLGTGSCARSAKGGSGGQQHTLLAATAPLHLQTRAQQRAQQRARRCVTPPFRPAASLPPCRRLPDGATLLLCIAPTHKDPPIAALALGLHLAGLPGHPRPVAATLYDSAPPVSCLYCAMAEEEGYGNDLKCDLAARSHPGGRGKSLLIPIGPKGKSFNKPYTGVHRLCSHQHRAGRAVSPPTAPRPNGAQSAAAAASFLRPSRGAQRQGAGGARAPSVQCSGVPPESGDRGRAQDQPPDRRPSAPAPRVSSTWTTSPLIRCGASGSGGCGGGQRPRAAAQHARRAARLSLLPFGRHRPHPPAPTIYRRTCSRQPPCCCWLAPCSQPKAHGWRRLRTCG